MYMQQIKFLWLLYIRTTQLLIDTKIKVVHNKESEELFMKPINNLYLANIYINF